MLRLFTRRTTARAQRFRLPAFALQPGMTLADGRTIEDVEVTLVTGDDRSAGRDCTHCGQIGSHHTDRHGEFTTVALTIERVDMENASRDRTPRVLTHRGSDLVEVTDFPATEGNPGTRVRAADSPLAQAVG